MLLKETVEHLYKKINEQHERDKVVGAPEEIEVKQKLEKYEGLLYNAAPKFQQADEAMADTCEAWHKALDERSKVNEENQKLYSKYLSLIQDPTLEDLNQLQKHIKSVGSERQRKKERVLTRQSQVIGDLNQKVETLASANKELGETLAKKEAELAKLQHTFKDLELKPVDSTVEEKLNLFMISNRERRQFQDESEELPPEWDRRFKDFIQEMSTGLKNATGEYPSNKSFPNVVKDWYNTMVELNQCDFEHKMSQRKQMAQSIRLALMRDIETDIEDIKNKLQDSKCSASQLL